MKKHLLYLLFISSFSNSQQMPQITPPSPEASSLFKFNEIPVSLHSGLHNTSIPLLEINSGGVNIPISLQYHSRGVQVNEIASRIGTGWALNYGGMISRQIRGVADETTYGYFNNSNSSSGYYGDENIREQERLAEISSYNNQTVQYDFFPDKFMINANFFSGEFYYDKNNSDFITQKFSDIKIVHQYDSNGYISEFQVIDNAGNSYYFGGLDVTGNEFVNESEFTLTTYTFNQDGLNSSNGNNQYFPYSSWFLRKIVTNTNEIIDFLYENETTTYLRRSGDTDDPVTCHFSRILSYQKILSEIRFKEGKVKFIKSEDYRLDVQGGYSLEKIELYDTNNQCVKQIKLNHEYKTSLGNDNINSNSVLLNDEYAKKRLFLKSIDFKNALGSSTDKSYFFEYDNQILPSRHSNSIDFWGYYNGKNRGNFINWENINYDDAVVNPIKVQAGLLKKITYPTGGFTTFEYEPNIVLNQLPFKFNEIQSSSYPHDYIIPNTNPVVLKEDILSYFEHTLYNYTTNRYEKQIVISQTAKGPFVINISQCNFEFTCQLLNNDLQGQNYFISNSAGQFSFPVISPGTYTFVFDPRSINWNPMPNGDPENTIAHSFTASIHWNDIVDGDKIYGPGNRIKKITNYSIDSSIEYSKFYSYKNETNNSPNGGLFSSSNYRIVKYMVGQFPIYDFSSYHFNGIFGSYSKDNLGYYSVDEFFLDKNGNAKDKITYKYSFFKDFNTYFLFPTHPISDNEWLRGLELSKIVYKKEDGFFKKVKEISNEYLLNNSFSISFLSTDSLVNTYPFGIVLEKPKAENFSSYPYLRNKTQFFYPNSTFMNLNHYVFNSNPEDGYRTSFFAGGTLDLKSTKVTDYFDNNTKVENLTTYTYDYDHHYNVSGSKITTSNNEELETKYFYALNLQSSINDSLVSKNIVGIPLKTEVKKDGELLSTQETIYKNWGNNLLAPEIIKIAKGDLPLKERIKYKKIDAKSNPLEIEQVGGIHICYIWGYNKTQPIAKIENATYAQVEQYVANLQSASNGTNEGALLSALDALRTALPNAMVTTYTYKPLIGISTVTDPKGDKQTYHYDSFNRLQYVKDKDGNILSENQYHYRTQN